MKSLLDTSAYSAFRAGNRRVLERVQRSRTILISSVVVGELLAGFRCGTRYDKQAEELRQFLDQPRVRFLPVTLTTGDRYARIYAAQRRKGKPIPTNDIWVAAHAMESGADLLSLDEHFGWIDGIAWVDLR